MPDRTVRAAVVSPVHPDLVTWLRARTRLRYLPGATQAELRDPVVATSHVLVLRSNVALGRDDVAGMPDLRLVVRAGSGTDNVDLAALSARGVELLRTGGADSAPAVAELALQATLALLRRVPVATAELARGRWEKHSSGGEELRGRTVAVWGAGPVGRAVAALFALLGTTVVFARHRGGPAGYRHADSAELAAVADVHVFALPRRPETTGYVGPRLLEAFRHRRPHLVNVGRWELFDMESVLGALCRGELSGVAVDPVDRAHVAEVAELVARVAGPDRPVNLQLTPHLGAMTDGALRRVAATAVAALECRWDRVRAGVRPHDGEGRYR